jgi:hypothetical protein
MVNETNCDKDGFESLVRHYTIVRQILIINCILCVAEFFYLILMRLFAFVLITTFRMLRLLDNYQRCSFRQKICRYRTAVIKQNWSRAALATIFKKCFENHWHNDMRYAFILLIHKIHEVSRFLICKHRNPLQSHALLLCLSKLR